MLALSVNTPSIHTVHRLILPLLKRLLCDTSSRPHSLNTQDLLHLPVPEAAKRSYYRSNVQYRYLKIAGSTNASSYEFGEVYDVNTCYYKKRNCGRRQPPESQATDSARQASLPKSYEVQLEGCSVSRRIYVGVEQRAIVLQWPRCLPKVMICKKFPINITSALIEGLKD